MSQGTRRFQTETVINVSQDHETPSPSSPSHVKAPPAADAQGDTEFIEDSFKEILAATDRKHVRPSQHAQPEHDELYSVTPERHPPKAAEETTAPLKTAQRSSKHACSPREPRKRPGNALEVLLATGAAAQKTAPMVKQLVVEPALVPVSDVEDDELQRPRGSRIDPFGAPTTVRKSIWNDKQVLVEAQDQSRHDDREDQLQSFNNDVPASVGSHPRSSKEAAKASGPSKTTTAPKTANQPAMGSRAIATGGKSSLAALRQRRGQDGSTPATAPTPRSANAVLRPRDANMQAAAVAAKDGPKDVAKSPVTSTTAKLRPVTKRVLAQTPRESVAPAQTSAKTTTKVRAIEKCPLESSNTAIAPMSKTAKPGSGNKGKSTLKRSARVMREPSAGQDSTYDLTTSPSGEDEAEYMPSKTNRRSKAAHRKHIAAANSPAKPTRRTARRLKAKMKGEESEVTEAAPAGAATSTRAKMKAISGSTTPAVASRKENDPRKSIDEKPSTALRDDDGDGDVHHEEVNMIATQPLHLQPMAKKSMSAKNKRNVRPENVSEVEEGYQDQNRVDAVQGASQQNAILLSDVQSSSDDEPSPIRDEVRMAPSKAINQTLRSPQTPVIFHSSPPAIADASSKPTVAGLVDPESVRKSTIISFDQSGPRNQGTASARSGRRDLVQSDRSAKPTAANGASSLAKIQAKRQSEPPSSVKSNKTSATGRPVAPSYIASNGPDALTGLRKARLVTRQSKAETRNDLSTLLYHPAQHNHHDDGFTNIDDFSGETLVETQVIPSPPSYLKPLRSLRTLSQTQMPPPRTKAEGNEPVHQAPIVPSMLQAGPQDATRIIAQNGESSVLGKRQQIDEQAFDTPPKRSRQESVVVPVHAQHSGSGALSMEAIVMQRKPSQADRLDEVVQQRAGSQRQLGRHRPQSTVDIHGSPVPDGMVVGGQNTVLETFSQQAASSPDHVVAARKIVPGNPGVASPDIVTVEQEQNPTTRLSSNTKVLPAEPDEQSQAIAHVARVRSGQTFVTAAAGHPPTDPFTRTVDERNKALKCSSSSSTFSEHLKKHAGGPVKSARPTPPQPDEEENDDPEKTLVEEHAHPHPHPQPPKRIESLPSDTSSSSSTSDSDAALSGLGLWRCALQPHQLNLFDELVAISHRLVRHLVSREQAATEIVDDYRRRGEALVRTLKTRRAENARAYADALRERKVSLRRELDECRRRLAEWDDEVKRLQAKGKGRSRAAADDGKSARLEEVMAAFC